MFSGQAGCAQAAAGRCFLAFTSSPPCAVLGRLRVYESNFNLELRPAEVRFNL